MSVLLAMSKVHGPDRHPDASVREIITLFITDGDSTSTDFTFFVSFSLLPLATMGFNFQRAFNGVKLDGKVVFISGAT